MEDFIQLKHVFVSSTVYDLNDERALIKRVLEEYAEDTGIRFQCVLSDHPDFPISPIDRATKHSYDMCIEAVSKCDYFVLVIGNRYGASVISHGGTKISITHREYREADRLNIPRFILVDSRTWDAKHKYDNGLPQTFVPSKQIGVFRLIDEIRKQKRGNWLDMYGSPRDLEIIVTTFLTKHDDSLFVADVTIPHGSIVQTNTKFKKTWEIKNNGLTYWSERYLREENPTPGGLIAKANSIPILDTKPGENVRITVEFKAPQDPAACESHWKMVDKQGNYCFPHKRGLDCRVKVI